MHPDAERSPGVDAPVPQVRTDGSLLRSFRRGNAQAADLLYRRYARRLLHLARTNRSLASHGRFDPEDIVQSAFRRFFAAAARGDYDLPTGEDLWGLMMVITLNRLRAAETYHRAAKRDVRTTNGAEALERAAAADLQDGNAVLERLVLDEALAELEPLPRQIVELRLAGHEVGSIALSVQRSRRSVERILHSVRVQLRRLLDLEDARADDESD